MTILVIDYLDEFPKSHLYIFDRKGSIVYEKEDYDNTFNGRSGKGFGLPAGTELPASTYFYRLDLGVDGVKPLTGFIEIIR